MRPEPAALAPTAPGPSPSTVVSDAPASAPAPAAILPPVPENTFLAFPKAPLVFLNSVLNFSNDGFKLSIDELIAGMTGASNNALLNNSSTVNLPSSKDDVKL